MKISKTDLSFIASSHKRLLNTCQYSGYAFSINVNFNKISLDHRGINVKYCSNALLAFVNRINSSNKEYVENRRSVVVEVIRTKC